MHDIFKQACTGIIPDELLNRYDPMSILEDFCRQMENGNLQNDGDRIVINDLYCRAKESVIRNGDK